MHSEMNTMRLNMFRILHALTLIVHKMVVAGTQNVWLWEMWARRGLVALCRVPRQHTATVIMAKQVTSGQKLAHALVQAQDADPRAATLPNMCSSHTIMLKDNANTLFRCFSVSLRRPHDLPPDRWEIVELPDAMPDRRRTVKEGLHR